MWKWCEHSPNNIGMACCYVAQTTRHLHQYDVTMCTRFLTRNQLLWRHILRSKKPGVHARVPTNFSAEIHNQSFTWDIDWVHRIGPWQRNADPRRPRAILVKFVRHNVKLEVIHNRRLLKGSNVVIREDLTSYRKHLLTDIRGPTFIQAAWSYDCRITALHNERKFTVRDRSDLEKFRAIVISGA